MPTIFKKIGELFLDVIETVVIALSLFLVVYLFAMQPHEVNGQSMVPNFQNGDYLLTDKVSYRFGEPAQGDVVVFHAPEAANCPKGTGCDFIKRVLAVPGDTVFLRDNKVYVNNKPLVEKYLPASLETHAGEFTQGGKTFTLGKDEYFVVGDNRPFSHDSRAWGPINKSEIIGRAFFRYWPVKVAGMLPKATY